MSSSEDTAAGAGCCGLFVVLAMIAIVLTYWKQILLAGLAIGAVTLLIVVVADAAKERANRAEQRRLCPVCNSWSNSVLLTELDGKGTGLCAAHAMRWQRIAGLEREVLRGN